MPNFFLSHKRVKVAGRFTLTHRRQDAIPDLRQTRRDPAQGPPESTAKLPAGTERNALGAEHREQSAMKLFTGWVLSIGLALAATGANAQTSAPYQTGNSPYRAVSDFRGPYAAMPEEMPEPAYGRPLLPPNEVYTVLRENGFSPLGAPQQRGLFYTIGVIDRYGEDGRLVIDARNGRIVRYMPAYATRNFYDDYSYRPAAPAGPLPPMANLRDTPRPPASIPRVASRTPPVPKPSPLTARPSPEPAQQSAAMAPKPVDPPPTPQAAPPAIEAKPAPQIAPTQPMPKVQGLE
jgi:hypothetical protein